MSFTRPSSIIEFARTAKAAASRLVQPTAGTIRDGYEPSQVVTRQQYNWLIKYLCDAVGWSYEGVDAVGGSAGSVFSESTLEGVVGGLSPGRVAVVSEVDDDAPLTLKWASAAIIGDRVFAAGDAVYACSTGAAGEYCRINRATGATVWTMTAPADYNVKGITGDGTYIYLTAESVASLSEGYIRKLDPATGATIATYASFGNTRMVLASLEWQYRVILFIFAALPRALEPTTCGGLMRQRAQPSDR